MATNWRTFPIEFKGGLISNLSPLQQGSNEIGSATILQNFEPARSGGYSKILGYTKATNSIIPGTGRVLGVKVANIGEYVAARSDGGSPAKTEYHRSSGTTWSSLGKAALLGGKIRSNEYNFGAGDFIIMVDGSNYPALFDDTNNTLSFINSLSDLQGAEQVAIFKTTVFLSKGSNLYFSAPSDSGDFSAANGGGVINVSHDITGLIAFRDQLIVFSRNNIQRLSGTTLADFQLNPITDGIGCLDPDTIQEVGGDIMYLSPDGIRLLGATDRIGDFSLEVASDPIADDAYKFTQSTSNFCSIVIREKAQYRIFGYTQSEQKKVSRGLLVTKFSNQGASNLAWGETAGIKAFVADSKYTDYSETIIFGNEDGYLYKMETGYSFDGDNIEAIYESPYMPVSDPLIRKTFYKLTTYVDPKGSFSVDLALKYDFTRYNNLEVLQPNVINITSSGVSVFEYGSSTATYGTATYGGELDKVYQNQIVGSGKTVSIRIEDNTTNPTFTLDTALLEFTQNDRQ
jgi:hypothetical protein